MSSTSQRTVAIAEVGAAHGLKGEVRLRSFTGKPMDVATYGLLTAPDGRQFEILSVRPAAGSKSEMMIARLKDVVDRNAAEALTGTQLSVPYDRLPPPEDGEYYHADLIGLSAVTADGTALGTVVAVQNYGAGDLLEIAPDRGETILVPFSDAAVPEIDMVAKRIVVVLPVFDQADEKL
jgi:16S rRNA processing protein RimM